MQKILWMDLEMTGLDPAQSVIIECAAIITNLQLESLDHYQAVVYQPQHELDKMDEWNVTTHGASGLTTEIPHGKPLATVESELLQFLAPHFKLEAPVLAGNSIHQDRKFIDAYMPLLSKRLHYRMIDVSAFKQIFRACYGLKFPKDNNHRALDDIRASIAELKYYLQYVQLPALGVPHSSAN